MKLISVCITMLVVALATQEVRAAKDGWLTDFEAAKAEAAKRGLPILADFSGSDWCSWCVKLDKEVLSTDAFKAYAKENFVLFLADFPQAKPQPSATRKQNEALAKRYGVRGFPTVLLLEADGKELARTGYQRGGAAGYIKHLKALIPDA